MNPMGMGMGMQPNMGVYNTMQMGGGAGQNPFAAAGGGMGYQNPNHNKPMYNTGAAGGFNQGGGPSAESWMRDVNELGMNVKLDVAPKRDNDNIAEFQDLFSSAKGKDWSTNAPKRAVDLSYNPGVAPSQAAAQAQPAP
jgi:hypothetical protein